MGDKQTSVEMGRVYWWNVCSRKTPEMEFTDRAAMFAYMASLSDDEFELAISRHSARVPLAYLK